MPAIGAAIKAIGSVIGGSKLLTGLLKVGGSLALSKLSQMLTARRERQPGREIDGLTAGETEGETIIVGNWATGGHMTYQGSWGPSNQYLTRVIELADAPGHALRSVILSGEFIQLSGVASEITPLNDRAFTGSGPIATGGSGAGAEATNDVVRSGGPLFWLRYHDGTQTTADAFMGATFNSANADRPYTPDMIGAGICYAVVTFRQKDAAWQNGVEPVFVLRGMPLYDPRFDSTVGGDGPQRWGQPETYAHSANPMVIAYNTARGIALPGGDTYGGGYGFADLPLSRWVAAMNVCDARGYQFGAEVNVVETEPAALIEACLEACGGQIAPIGGALIPQVGPPDVPVWAISDNDMSADEGAKFDPVTGLAERYNAVQGGYVAPAQLWQPRALPLLTNPAWEAEDGGRRLPADMPLAGVYIAAQAQDLIGIYARDGRRQRTHTLTLAPDAARMSVFDTVTLTRPQDGYEGKLVEVVGFEQRTDDTFCVVTLREVDPSDYAPPAQVIPEPPQPMPLPIVFQEVPGFAVSQASILDSDNVARRAGALLVWDYSQFEDVAALSVEIRIAGAVEPTLALQIAAEPGRHVQELLPATLYEIRAQLVAERRTEWTTWRQVLTPDVRLSPADLDSDLWEQLQGAQSIIDGALDSLAGVIGDLRDETFGALGVQGDSIRDLRDRLKKTADDLTDLSALAYMQRETIRVQLTAQVDDARAEYTQQINVLAGQALALAQEVTQLDAELAGKASVAALDLLDTRVEEAEGAITAQGQAITALTAEVETGATATALGALTVRVTDAEDDITAAAGRLDLLEVTAGDNAAAISTLAATKVDSAGAVAAVNQQISAQYGSISAMAEATAFAEANADGSLAGFRWELFGQDVIAAVAVQPDGQANPSVNIRLRGESIILDGDTLVLGGFVVSGGNVILDGDTTVAGDFLAQNAIFAGSAVQSDNFVSGPDGDGWRIGRNGDAEFGTLALRRGSVAESHTAPIPMALGGGGQWVPISQITFTPEAAGNLIQFFVRTTCATTFSGTTGTALFRIWRTSFSALRLDQSPNYTYGSGGIAPNGTDLVMHTHDFAPAATPQTYRLERWVTSGSPPSHSGTFAAVEFKR